MGLQSGKREKKEESSRRAGEEDPLFQDGNDWICVDFYDILPATHTHTFMLGNTFRSNLHLRRLKVQLLISDVCQVSLSAVHMDD